MKPLTVQEIREAAAGSLLSGAEDLLVTGVEMDSRIMKPGDCFFALSGERSDGNDYIKAAFSGGAVCAVVTDPARAEEAAKAFPGRAVIVVKDAQQALGDLAAYYLRKFQIPKVAVTGSNGKTTTKDMLHAVLSQKYKTHKTPVNRNNLIGLPLTVLSLEEDAEAAVFEMGMDTFGEIHRMAEIVRPDIAIITNVGVAHIERLGSREGILSAKLEIRDFFGPENVLIINDEGDLLNRAAARGNYRLVTVGRNGKNDFILSDVESSGEDGTAFTLEHGESTQRYILPVPGEYNAVNASLAAAAASLLGISPGEVKKGLAAFRPSEKRMDIRGAHGIKVIDDTYNASPPAMRAAIDVLMSTKGVRKVAILGDMFELGEKSEEYHREVGRYAAESGVQLFIGVGERSRFACESAAEILGAERVAYFAEKSDLESQIENFIGSGDVVLVKGSRGMAMETIVKKILEQRKG